MPGSQSGAGPAGANGPADRDDDGGNVAAALAVAVVAGLAAALAAALLVRRREHRPHRRPGGRAVTGAARRVAIPLLAGSSWPPSRSSSCSWPRTATAGPTAPRATPAAVAANQPDPTGGRLVFAQMGCGSCHALKAAGSRGEIGPSLDLALKQHSRSSLAAKIQRPGAGTIMPQDFAQRMTFAELDALLDFLMAARGGGSGSS